jgi:O-antigen/teichoic acid export membrane protein
MAITTRASDWRETALGRRSAGKPKASPRPEAKRPKPASLINSLAYFVPSYFLAIIGYLALNVIAARMLGPSGFGYYVVLVTVTTFVGQVSLLGVARSGLREAAHAHDAETLADLRRGVQAVLRIPLPLASALTGAAVWAWQGGDDSAVVTAILTAVLVYECGYGVVTTNFLRGLGHLRAANLLAGRSGGALVAVAQVACLLVVATFAPDSGLPGVLLGTVTGYALVLGWVWWLLQRSWPHSGGPVRPLRDLRTVLKRDWKFTFSQTGGFLNSTVELWLGAALLTAPEASLFAAAQRIGRLLVIPAASLQIVFSPAISRLARADNRRELELLVRTAASVTTVVSGVLWVPMVLAPDFVLRMVFSDGFAPAASALMLISTGYLLNSVSGMSGTTLSMSHHEGDMALISWCVVSARVVSGVLCVWAFGLVALAASSAVISVLYYAATWSAVRRRLAISTHATLRPRMSLLTRISG